MSASIRKPSEPTFAAVPNTCTTILRSCYSEDSRHSSELLDELKENISPLRPSPSRRVEKLNALKKNVVDLENGGDQLLIVEDMGTPLRRTTFIKDTNRCSPKCVTRTPERRIVNVDGFQSNVSSPPAVPDCYATPLRRTTFVKNSPNLKAECAGAGHFESSLVFGKLSRNLERSAESEITSHVCLDSVPDEPSGRTSKILRQHQKPDDLLRDVSKSPLILEDRLLHLQDVSQSDKPFPERPRRSVASSRCSPGESEYHTAVTTPYDQSFSEDEDIDEFVDSHICSETITGDLSLCQQQLALKSSTEVTFTGNDYVVMENMVVEDLSKLPLNTASVNCVQTDIVTSAISTYEVYTEVVSEVLKSERNITEMSESSCVEEVKRNCTSAAVNTVECEQQIADFERVENEHLFFHSSKSQIDDFQYNTDILSNDCIPAGDDDNYSATGYDAYKRLSSTPVLNHEKVNEIGTDRNYTAVPVVDSKLPQAVNTAVEVPVCEAQTTHLADCEPGVFRIPFENDISCSFNSKVCATPSFTADMAEDTESYNRTYSKSASHNSVTNLSGSRSARASRPLFTDSMVGIKSAEDESDGVLPLSMTESGYRETTLEQPRAYHLPKSELLQSSLQLSRVWSDGEMSVMDTGVISQVGGQTRHMISPGQKRQSLIARLHDDTQRHFTQSSHAVVGIGHSKREHLERDSSPVRKRPLIAVSKPSTCWCLLLYFVGEMTT